VTKRQALIIPVGQPQEGDMGPYRGLALAVLQRAVSDVRDWLHMYRWRSTNAPERVPQYAWPETHDAAAFVLGGIKGEETGLQHWLDLGGVSRQRWNDAVYAAVGDAPAKIVALPVRFPNKPGRAKRRRYVA
jgi:hypothetical protein